MTYQEAVYTLGTIKWVQVSDSREAKEREAIAMAIEALEKQIPRKPRYVQYDGNQEVGNYHCTTCERIIELEPIDHNEKVFCLHCGQAIDWSDE